MAQPLRRVGRGDVGRIREALDDLRTARARLRGAFVACRGRSGAVSFTEGRTHDPG